MIRRAAARRGASDAVRRALAAGLALAAFTLASCATPPPLREIDGSADGSRVTLVPGQALRITVNANPATGYRWVVDRAAAAVLLPVGQPMYTPTSTSVPLVGAGGTMTFDFVASAAGSDTLQLAYRRQATQDAVARSLRVEVVVQ
jgi:inhibitor of cysteine peptidase